VKLNEWVTSSYSGDNGECVEVMFTGVGFGVRDSKNPTGGTLTFTDTEWAAFTAGVRDGEFDG